MKKCRAAVALTATAVASVAACGNGTGAAESGSTASTGASSAGAAVSSASTATASTGTTATSSGGAGSSAVGSAGDAGASNSTGDTTGSSASGPETADASGSVTADAAAPGSDSSTLVGAEASAPSDGSGPADAASLGDAEAAGACPTGMVRIPAKNQSFMMGFDPNEAPGTIWACYLGKHQVMFTYDYCMDAKLVTQEQFSRVMGFNPSKHVTADPTLPVDSETWYDAMRYCNTKSMIDGRQPAYSYGAVTLNGKSASDVAGVTVDIKKNGYRLPTNAEYEYAERANTVGLYFFSPTATADITALGAVYAWYSVNSGGVSQPVGKLKPNPWGLYDIVGDLFEWENDWEGPYVTTPEIDPVGPATGTGCGTFDLGVQKMAKGGSWHTDVATHMRISYHFKWKPSAVHPELGFRCVATAD